MYHADQITVPVLLLHGAQDAHVPVQQAEAFAEKLRAHGVAVTLKFFPIPGMESPLMNNTARYIHASYSLYVSQDVWGDSGCVACHGFSRVSHQAPQRTPSSVRSSGAPA